MLAAGSWWLVAGGWWCAAGLLMTPRGEVKT